MEGKRTATGGATGCFPRLPLPQSIPLPLQPPPLFFISSSSKTAPSPRDALGMKLLVVGTALAAATLAQAGAADFFGAEPRQLGRRLNSALNNSDLAGAALEKRASSSKAKAVAAAKAAAAKAAAAKAKAAAAAASKNKAAAL